MSTLNQAFIKAYQRRGVGAPHMPMPVVKQAGTAPLSVAPQPEATPELATDRPAPAVFLQPQLPTVSSAASEAVASEAVASQAAAIKIASDELCPAYEVERFEWPGVVISLLDQTRPALTVLVNELLPGGRGVLLVGGCRRGEGRTTTALMLARYLVENGSQVALVDADFQNPRAAASLGTVADVGWEQALLGNAPLGEALIESLADRVTLLPLRRRIDERTLAAGGAALAATLNRLRAKFDVVCIDGGPLAEAGDIGHEALFGDAPIEAAVVLRDARHGRLEQTHAVGRRLVQLGVSRWAIIENFV